MNSHDVSDIELMKLTEMEMEFLPVGMVEEYFTKKFSRGAVCKKKHHKKQTSPLTVYQNLGSAAAKRLGWGTDIARNLYFKNNKSKHRKLVIKETGLRIRTLQLESDSGRFSTL